jgi:hypothetical protein
MKKLKVIFSAFAAGLIAWVIMEVIVSAIVFLLLGIFTFFGVV